MTSETDRLFVPLNSEPYRWFEEEQKDIELRGVNSQFHGETVRTGRPVELRRGYSTDDSIWGVIGEVWNFLDYRGIPDVIDHQRITPGASEREFYARVEEMLGHYEEYIAFEVVDRVD